MRGMPLATQVTRVIEALAAGGLVGHAGFPALAVLGRERRILREAGALASRPMHSPRRPCVSIGPRNSGYFDLSNAEAVVGAVKSATARMIEAGEDSVQHDVTSLACSKQ